jgi:hypothetical protein
MNVPVPGDAVPGPFAGRLLQAAPRLFTTTSMPPNASIARRTAGR